MKRLLKVKLISTYVQLGRLKEMKSGNTRSPVWVFDIHPKK